MESVLRRAHVWIVLVGVAFVGLGCPQQEPCPDCATLVHDGLLRHYLAHFPPSYDSATLLPLVIVLHGADGTPQLIRDMTGFDDIADREQFVVVYPEGIDKQWNDGRGVSLGTFPITAIDDVGFISELVDTLISSRAINPLRVYVVGESNGGMLAQRLAFEFTDKFAAVASVIASIPNKVASTYVPKAPVSMLMINSVNDPIVPWNGGDVRIGIFHLGSVLSVQDAMAFWGNNNACPTAPVEVQLPDRDPADGTRVWLETSAHGTDNTEVVLYRIDGAGHSWPGGLIPQDGQAPNNVCNDINASEVVWNFFKGKSR
jgi:polyhydroxybutyrate depolymerase